MKSRKKKSEDKMVTVSTRLLPKDARLLEMKAAEAQMSRGEYMRARLLGEEPEPWTKLATLARVIAIYHAVRANAGSSDLRIAELRSVFETSVNLARVEAER